MDAEVTDDDVVLIAGIYTREELERAVTDALGSRIVIIEHEIREGK